MELHLEELNRPSALLVLPRHPSRFDDDANIVPNSLEYACPKLTDCSHLRH